jgi:hypothetical protein
LCQKLLFNTQQKTVGKNQVVRCILGKGDAVRTLIAVIVFSYVGICTGSDYYPLARGNFWTYAVQDTSGVVHYVKTEVVSGTVVDTTAVNSPQTLTNGTLISSLFEKRCNALCLSDSAVQIRLTRFDHAWKPLITSVYLQRKPLPSKTVPDWYFCSAMTDTSVGSLDTIAQLSRKGITYQNVILAGTYGEQYWLPDGGAAGAAYFVDKIGLVGQDSSYSFPQSSYLVDYATQYCRSTGILTHATQGTVARGQASIPRGLQSSGRFDCRGRELQNVTSWSVFIQTGFPVLLVR